MELVIDGRVGLEIKVGRVPSEAMGALQHQQIIARIGNVKQFTGSRRSDTHQAICVKCNSSTSIGQGMDTYAPDSLS